MQLNKYGIGLEQVRTALAAPTPTRPRAISPTAIRMWEVGANDQIFKAAEYRR